MKPDQIATDKLLTRQEVGQLINADGKTVERMAADGRLPAAFDLAAKGAPRRMLRWRLSDIQRWLESGCQSMFQRAEGTAT